jgi:hypothetical protein
MVAVVVEPVQGLEQDPAVDQRHLTIALGSRDETSRGNGRAVLTTHPHQHFIVERFERRPERDDRLELEEEALRIDLVLKVLLDLELLQVAAQGHVLLRHMDNPIAPLGFRLGASLRTRRYHVADIHADVNRDDTHAGGDGQDSACYLDRPAADCLVQPLRAFRRFIRVAGEHDDPEGVTDAGDLIPGPQFHEQLLASSGQELVSYQMAIKVVERLETIYIKLDQCTGGARCGHLDSTLHCVIQSSLIKCLGLKVVINESCQGHFSCHSSCDVLNRSLILHVVPADVQLQPDRFCVVGSLNLYLSGHVGVTARFQQPGRLGLSKKHVEVASVQ